MDIISAHFAMQFFHPIPDDVKPIPDDVGISRCTQPYQVSSNRTQEKVKTLLCQTGWTKCAAQKRLFPQGAWLTLREGGSQRSVDDLLTNYQHDLKYQVPYRGPQTLPDPKTLNDTRLEKRASNTSRGGCGAVTAEARWEVGRWMEEDGGTPENG